VATCIGVNELKGNSDGGITVYPNPNSGNFIIRSDVNLTLRIINTLGQLVSEFNLSDDNRNEILINNLESGIYFIQGDSKRYTINKKIVVEK
jgi:hypothetical protein